MKRKHVYEIARDTGLPSARVIQSLRSAGVPVTTASSKVDADAARQIVENAAAPAPSPEVPEEAYQPVAEVADADVEAPPRKSRRDARREKKARRRSGREDARRARDESKKARHDAKRAGKSRREKRRFRRRPRPDDGRIRPDMKRQWGTEKEPGAAPVMHAAPSRRAMSGARFALFLTLAAWVAYSFEQIRRYIDQPFTLLGTIEAAAYLAIVTLLAASASSYLLARLGHLQRIRSHRRLPRAVLDAVFDEANPTMTVIVPSYREDRRIIRQTLLSAALQEYPSLRAVLLIDDPPDPADERSRQMLEDSRSVPGEIAALLQGPRERFERALAVFEASPRSGGVGGFDLIRLADAYGGAESWLRRAAQDEQAEDHSDAFLANDVMLRLADDLAEVSQALREAADAGAEISVARARQLHRRLVWIFRAELDSFERKTFASLSHEPNKAMNLNSYIGLMGGRYRIRDTHSGSILLPVRAGAYDLEIPDPDYVLTLDADSMLLPEYCLRLVAFLQRPENSDVAVIQTPYSAFRGAPSRIERLAGATTDLQHIVHQGLTHYGATFWVGANAILRKSALEDVKVEEPHNGFTIRTYIQDRTPIEDTESSLDLRLHGWRLHNYPERLSYSATPPDFGALSIQRQRWANGGLVIIPRLWELIRRGNGSGRRATFFEAFLRLNYLASIAWASLGLALLLFYPFDQALLSSYAVLTALPYFVAQSTDLRRSGYRRLDVLRLYGFNIMLLAVNTVGAVKSLGQAIGGQKVAFARTPKVKNRTVTPIGFVLIPLAIVGWSTFTLVSDIGDGQYLHAAFAGFNAFLTGWVLLTLHGVRNMTGDILHDLRERLYAPPRRAAASATTPDWMTVVYHGSATSGESADAAAAASALAALDQELEAENEIMLADGGQALAPAILPDAAPPAEADGLEESDAEALARALSERLLELKPGGTVTLRMLDQSLSVSVDEDHPVPAATDSPPNGTPEVR